MKHCINEYLLSRPGYVFNSHHFFLLHHKKTSLIFDAVVDGKSEISVYFHSPEPKSYSSPMLGSFGGIVGEENISLANYVKFAEEVHNSLLEMGANKIEIKAMPSSYDERHFSRQLMALRYLNYKIKFTDINQHIEIESWNRQLLSKSNRKLLRKLIEKNFEFLQVEKNCISEVYELLKRNRENKGRRLSMELDDILNMETLFPGILKLFCVRDDKKIVASSICLSIGKNCLYVFYWGHDITYNFQSPIVLLCDGIIGWAKDHKYALLDLGTSSLNGKIDLGLAKFKSGLGAKEGIKMTYEWRG